MLCSMVPMGNFLAGPLADLFTVRHVMLSQAVLIWILLMLFVLIKIRPILSKPAAWAMVFPFQSRMRQRRLLSWFQNFPPSGRSLFFSARHHNQIKSADWIKPLISETLGTTIFSSKQEWCWFRHYAEKETWPFFFLPFSIRWLQRVYLPDGSNGNDDLWTHNRSLPSEPRRNTNVLSTITSSPLLFVK